MSATFKVERDGKPLVQLKACCTCRWFVAAGKGDKFSRCHANPPNIRFPYHDMSAWPVVPESGGGCRMHEDKP